MIKREKSEFEDFADNQYDKAEEEINILKIVNTIQKLKAGMIALYDDQKEEKVNIAKLIFLNQRMVPLQKKTKVLHYHNSFSGFLNTNYLNQNPLGSYQDNIAL